MAFNSLNQNILFSSKSTAQTRAWSRYEGVDCSTSEKLKYTVLKNPPSTVPTRVVGCASRATTVDVGGRTYGIDPSIFLALTQLLKINPAFTLVDLQARIAETRVLVNRPAPIAVQLIDFPLGRYKRRLTYLAGSSKWSEVIRSKPREYQFKVGGPIDIVMENFPLIALYEHFFANRTFKLQNAQYIYVGNNDGCGYTGRLADLYTTASQNGALIRPVQQTRSMFIPIVCIMQPASANFPSKLGLLLGINSQTTSGYDFPSKDAMLSAVALNSELVFIPAQNQIEVIENKDLPVNMGVTFPLTNGGILTHEFLHTFNNLLRQFFRSNSAFKTLRSNIQNIFPLLIFSQSIVDHITSDLNLIANSFSTLTSALNTAVDSINNSPLDVIINTTSSVINTIINTPISIPKKILKIKF